MKKDHAAGCLFGLLLFFAFLLSGLFVTALRSAPPPTLEQLCAATMTPRPPAASCNSAFLQSDPDNRLGDWLCTFYRRCQSCSLNYRWVWAGSLPDLPCIAERERLVLDGYACLSNGADRKGVRRWRWRNCTNGR